MRSPLWTPQKWAYCKVAGFATPTRDVGSDKRYQFNFQDSPDVAIDLKDSVALQANKLAEHEGKLSGLTTIVQSLQSYKGFLQAAILTMGTLMLALTALLMTHQFSTAARLEKAGTDLGARMTTLETKVDALPDRVSQSVREVSRDLVIISRQPEPQPAPPANKITPPNR